VSVSANITGGNILTGGVISATGNITGGNLSVTGIAGTLSTAAQTAITSVGTLTSLAVTGNITGGNLSVTGIAGTLSTAAQTAITSVGTLTSLAVTGNITGGNLSVTGIAGTLSTAAQTSITSVGTLTSLAVTGNISGGNILGGANVNATTHTGTTVSVTGNITAGNISVTGISGTLSTAAQTSITSVGTLTSLAVTGNISGGNVLGGANVNATTHTGTTVSVTGNITGGNILGGANVNATTHTGTTVSVTSTVTGSQFNGSGAGLTSIPAANVTGTLSVNTSGYAATVSGAAQGNITSVGTLTGLTINNATTAITNAATTGTGNIGASGAAFNTVFAKATTAQYADLAEMYTSDAEYEPGTVMDFGGDQEITISTRPSSDRVAGVVSTNPAHLMNSTQTGEHVVAVALTGRVPTRVTGTIWKGAMMVSAGNGQATACATPAIGTVLGKSLEDFSGESGTIQVVVGRL
jgi:hypothetical protein